MAEIFDVFLSYNHDDQEPVRELVQALRNRGVRIWRDREDLPLGQSWQRVVQEVIPTAPAAAAVIGPSGIGDWHGREIEACQTQNVKRKMTLVLILLPGAPDPATLPVFLSELTWFDLREGFATEMLNELARRIPRRPAEAEPRPPDSGPRLHNLPFLSIGDLLKGRDDDLQALATNLQGPSRATVIYGLGGVGKTRLAVEYAWRYGDRYEAVFFIGADAPETLRANLAALAGPNILNLLERQASAEAEVMGAVLRWLREKSGWLLILDNVDTEAAEQAVLELLPSFGRGYVLIASRRADWPFGIEEEILEKLSPDEATQFLLQRTQKRRVPKADDPEKAARLAKILDGLPLALEQAGAYIRYRRISFSDYLEDWDKERESVLKWFNPTVSAYLGSVAFTWQKTFGQLGPTAKTILRLTSFLAPKPIPIEIFKRGEEIVKRAVALLQNETEEIDGQQIQDALGDLASYSMISHEGRMFRVHRMVQEVIRIQIPGDREQQWIREALTLLTQYPPADPVDVRTWPIWELLRPHAAELVRHGNRVGVGEQTVALINSLTGFLYGKAVYDEAEPLLQRAVSLTEASLGPEHPSVATYLNNLAQLLQDTNRLAEAEPLMRRALAIDERSFGKDNPRVASRLNNLASLLQTTNRLAEAEPLMRRALAIDEKFFGNEHPNVAIHLNNLASLLQTTNRLEEAESLIRRALAIDQACFGTEDPRVAVRLKNLAFLLKVTNRLAEAEPLIRRALAIDEKSFGNEHPSVAVDLNNLATLLQAANRLAEAEPLMRRALAIDEKSFGGEHPNVAIRLNNLASLLQTTNRLAEAEPLLRRALVIDEKSFEPNHPDIAVDLNNLAALLQATNRLSEAEPLMRRGLAIDEASFGADHPNVAIRLNNLAQLLQATNRLSEAEPLMRRAVEICERNLVSDHPNTQIARRNLEILLSETAAERDQTQASLDGTASEEPED